MLQSLLALAPTRIRTARSTQPHNAESSSVHVLPVELLLKVFKHLDRNTLSTCMQVCWRWYGVASRCFFAVVPIRYSHRQPLFEHLRAHPELAACVQELHFFDKTRGDWGWPTPGIKPRPFDIQLLASTLPLFTNLTRLSITGCDNKTDLPRLLRCMTRRPRTPVPLQRLTLTSCRNNALILHGLSSLFFIDTLVVGPAMLPRSHQMSAAHIKALFPPASVTLQNLVIRKNAEHLYEFLERALVPGRLRGLVIAGLPLSRWREALPYVVHWQFLRSPAARNLLSIGIGNIEDLYDPHQAVTGTPWVHKTPGPTIAQCTRVQYVRLGVVHRQPVEYLSTPLGEVCPLLANIPASLRALSLHVWIAIYPSLPQSWFNVARGWNSAMESLAAVDQSLDPAGAGRRFPHLRRIELHAHFWSSQKFSSSYDAAEKHAMRDIERVADPLPRLKAAGLLREFRVDNVVCGPSARDFMDDVYWPSDSET